MGLSGVKKQSSALSSLPLRSLRDILPHVHTRYGYFYTTAKLPLLVGIST